MSNRYRIALAMGRDAYKAAVDEDAELLEYYGMKLLSVEDSVRAAVNSELRGSKVIHPWNVVEISMKVWNWVRPLLVRLRDLEEDPAEVDLPTLLAAK
jgi:hypothetical protein